MDGEAVTATSSITVERSVRAVAMRPTRSSASSVATSACVRAKHWTVGAMLVPRGTVEPTRCSLDLALRVRRAGTVHDGDEPSLGAWCFADDVLKAGAC